MHKNKNGFTVIEVIIVIVVFSAIITAGYAGYKRINNNNVVKQSSTSHTQPSSQDSTKQRNTKPTDQPNTENSDVIIAGSIYTDTKAGIKYFVPEKWTRIQHDYGSENNIAIISMTSPDYAPQGGYGESNTGSEVTIIVDKITGSSYIPEAEEILNGKRGKETLTEIKPVTIAGVNGVTYKASYEGPARLAYQFDHNNIRYIINLDEDMDGPTFNDNLDIFQKIIESFTLLPDQS